RTAAAQPRCHRAVRGELHGLHAVRARVSRLVHLHRLAQGDPPRGGRRPGPHPQRPRPVRDRLRAVHVLRHLRRGVPVRRAVLVAGVRVRRVRHRGADAREGAAARVDVDRPAAAGPRPRRRAAEGDRRGGEGGGAGRAPVSRDARMSGQEIVFTLLGVAAVGSAVLVVTTRRLVHAALWLVVSFGALAGGYLVLTAEFVAWVQVLIY